MSAPPATEAPDDEFDYVEEEEEEEDDDDSEDDDEADFVPGANYEEEDDSVVPLMDGHLFLKDDQLHFQGPGFHLTTAAVTEASAAAAATNSTAESPSWNLLSRLEKPKETRCNLRMEGSCDIMETGNTIHRKFDVTVSLQDPAAATANGSGKSPARLKGGDDRDDQDSKLPPYSYSVFGHQLDSASGCDSMEFQGAYHPGDGKRVSLVCRVRTVVAKPAATAAATGVRPAAAAAAAHRVDDDDDDDDDDDADSEVDMEELIALHEDAGLPVDALRKRYHNGGDNGHDDDGEGKKRAKPAPKVDDDDDDDDYGF